MPSSANEINDRLLRKLSGEASAAGDHGVDAAALDFRWQTSPRVTRATTVCICCWGSNCYRGHSAIHSAINRNHADCVDMLATVMNGIILQQWTQAQGLATTVLSAFPVGPMCNSYSPAETDALLESGSLFILAGGTGFPFFTTDTATSL